MRIGSLRIGDQTVAALVSGERAAILSDACRRSGHDVGGDVLSLLQRWDDVEPALRDAHARLDELFDEGLAAHAREQLAAPIPRPGKVIAIGRNYAEHAAELGNDVPAEPLIFVKHTTSVNGPFDPIPRPSFVKDLDYEAELAVVIGRRCRDISAGDALDHVIGYCCANDVSARTAQFATGQFVRGKSFDGFCPLGPAIVTRDEVPDVQALRVVCRVDGQTRQELDDRADDLRRGHARRPLQPGDDARARRRHPHRHAGWRGDGPQAAAVARAWPGVRGGDRGHRDDRQPHRGRLRRQRSMFAMLA